MASRYKRCESVATLVSTRKSWWRSRQKYPSHEGSRVPISLSFFYIKGVKSNHSNRSMFYSTYWQCWGQTFRMRDWVAREPAIPDRTFCQGISDIIQYIVWKYEKQKFSLVRLVFLSLSNSRGYFSIQE